MKASIACNVRWGIYIESGIKKMEFQRSVDHKRLNRVQFVHHQNTANNTCHQNPISICHLLQIFP